VRPLFFDDAYEAIIVGRRCIVDVSQYVGMYQGGGFAAVSRAGNVATASVTIAKA